MGLNPRYRIFADNEDVTNVLHDRVVSISITDNAGMESDTLNLTIDDSDDVVEIPASGVRLDVLMGYDNDLVGMGSFIVDDIQFNSTPQKYEIRASAAPLEGQRVSAMQSQKNRSFDDVVLGDVVDVIAKEHNLESFVSANLRSIPVPHLDQIDESDINLVTRLAQDLNAVAKPAGGKLLFVQQGAAQSSSGDTIAPINISVDEVTSYAWKTSTASKAGTVIATYHDFESGETLEVEAGGGEPVNRIRYQYPTKEEAERAAKSRIKAIEDSKSSISLQMVGNAFLAAELKLNLIGFKKNTSGEWVIKTVTHTLDSGGFKTTISASRGEVVESPSDTAPVSSE